jgi:hypothetical protein
VEEQHQTREPSEDELFFLKAAGESVADKTALPKLIYRRLFTV